MLGSMSRALIALRDRVAKADRPEAVDFELDVDELLKVGLKILRLFLHLLGQCLAFDIFETESPAAVELFYI